jgi:regulatory subunit for Cdc7p protein kinase
MLSSNATDVPPVNGQPTTINPAVLERSSEAMSAQGQSLPSKAAFTFEAPLSRRFDQGGQESDVRKAQGSSVDVLSKAREMGMKIWALEKLQRMMTTMFNTDTGSQSQHGHNTRSNATNVSGKVQRGSDLSELLRNERLNGPSDRDLTVASRDLILFKGPFIYIHDMDEKSKPIMVRDYPRVHSKEDGAWPMFRSVSGGKCPFVQEAPARRRDWERELARELEMRKKWRMKNNVPQTRASKATLTANMEPPPAITGKRPLAEMESGSSGMNVVGQPTKYQAIEHPKTALRKNAGTAEVSSKEASTSCSAFGAPTAQLYGGEPVASGVQPSNITSAIRSQMISSTAAAPGAKAGLSKEVHELKRKVLQKNSGQPVNGIPASQRRSNLSNAANAGAGGAGIERNTASFRNGRSKTQEKLKCVEEESSASDGETRAGAARPNKPTLLDRKQAKKDPKPGYCENCREKFEDFEEVSLP